MYHDVQHSIKILENVWSDLLFSVLMALDGGLFNSTSINRTSVSINILNHHIHLYDKFEITTWNISCLGILVCLLPHACTLKSFDLPTFVSSISIPDECYPTNEIKWIWLGSSSSRRMYCNTVSCNHNISAIHERRLEMMWFESCKVGIANVDFSIHLPNC